MLRSPAPARRRATALIAGLLGTAVSFAPAARGAECAECLAPALAPSVGFAGGGPSLVQAQPVLRSYTRPAPVVGGPSFGGPAYGAPVYGGPSFGGPCGPSCGPRCPLPRPFDCYNGPRRLSGLPAHRPFGLPMLAEIGAAVGVGVGTIGSGLGALADDVLLGPVVHGGGCGPWACGPPHCGIKPCSIQPLASFCPPMCGSDAGLGCGPVCPPPLAPLCPPACAAPVCPPPACAAPICPPPACAAPICPPPSCGAPPVCTELVPQTTTKYARRECVTWKEVECVAYRPQREEYVEPVCRTRCRTVDRGCWKRIWVPKLVTEEYTTTDYVRRCRIRRVPYTYTKQVAERSERLVPYCATTYVPRPVCAVLPEPGCGAPNFAPTYPGGEQYGGATFGGESYGGEQYGEFDMAPHTGVPGVEYAAPGAPSTLTPQPQYGTPSAPGAPITPIPEDSFSGETSSTHPPNWNPQTSMTPNIPARAAARGWVEEAPKARRF